MVQRLSLPNAPTATALAVEVGVPQQTLSRWRRTMGSVAFVATKGTPGAASGSRRPEDWSAQERLRVVMEASKLGDAELGEFLRREGLHEETLAQWRDAVMEALQPAQSPNARGGDKKRIKQLEREIARKDKALAEAAALIILKKKAQAIWGDEDDGMDEENDK